MTVRKKLIAGPEIEVTESLSCDNCAANIPLVIPNPDGLTQQGDNALEIRFLGGYGMFIDPIGEYPEKFEMLWCERCAQDLADKYPSIAERIGRGYKQPATT